MGYGNLNQRREAELASKINHSVIINSSEIKEFLDSCDIIDFNFDSHVMPKGFNIDCHQSNNIEHVFAIDGGYNETFINKNFPSSSITYFNVGVLSFAMRDYGRLSNNVIINPSDLKKIKDVSRTIFAIPTKNIIIKGTQNFVDSVRFSIHQIFLDKKCSSLKSGNLYETLKWVLFEQWDNFVDEIKINCTKEECDGEVSFNTTETKKICSRCGKEIFLTDYLSLHSLINEATGASGIVSFLCGAIEQLYIAEIIRYFYMNNIDMLNRIIFIKDGPLAFFSKTFRICKKYRNMLSSFLIKGVHLNIIGLEKSGPFVDHLCLIKDKLEINKYYILNDDYIRKYIAPQDTDTIYGFNTYYGKKIMFKTENGDVLIATIPVSNYKDPIEPKDLISVIKDLKTISDLRCNLYDNSLVPIALINKLVSISALPSSNILEKFTKSNVNNSINK